MGAKVAIAGISQDQRELVLGKKTVNPLTGCWEFTGSRFGSGYGQQKVGGRNWRAHRLVWEIFNGEVPGGLSVLHRCDVRHCINPKHLFLGTHDDNMADMVAKGRSPIGDRNSARKYPHHYIGKSRGALNGMSKLSEDDVVKIKRMLMGGGKRGYRADIARAFSVSSTTIYTIENGKVWGHIHV